MAEHRTRRTLTMVARCPTRPSARGKPRRLYSAGNPSARGSPSIPRCSSHTHAFPAQPRWHREAAARDRPCPPPDADQGDPPLDRGHERVL